MDNQPAIRDDVVAFLQQNIGNSYSIPVIAKNVKAGVASVRYVLGKLDEQRVVRRSSGEREARFYIPTNTQLQVVGSDLKSHWKPLKPRTLHAQRIADIRAERNAIPSIG